MSRSASALPGVLRAPSLGVVAAALGAVAAALGLAAADAAEPSPRLMTARDPKLDREFEYLVFDLGAGVELRLVKVPAAGKTFTIGSTPAEQARVVERYHAGKRPATLDFEEAATVTLSDDFFIGQFEVCREQFRRFVTETGYVTDGERAEGGYGFNEATLKGEGRDRKYTWQNTGITSAGEQHPVTNVSRDDAQAFCAWLRKKCDGAVTVRDLRLPGEAEWEFACRAGSEARFCTGDDDEALANVANVADAAWKEKLGGPNAAAIAANDGHVFAAPVGHARQRLGVVRRFLRQVLGSPEDGQRLPDRQPGGGAAGAARRVMGLLARRLPQRQPLARRCRAEPLRVGRVPRPRPAVGRHGLLVSRRRRPAMRPARAR
jgi:formylglycine-generating enzyme required for sulfatase activity